MQGRNGSGDHSVKSEKITSALEKRSDPTILLLQSSLCTYIYIYISSENIRVSKLGFKNAIHHRGEVKKVGIKNSITYHRVFLFA